MPASVSRLWEVITQVLRRDRWTKLSDLYLAIENRIELDDADREQHRDRAGRPYIWWKRNVRTALQNHLKTETRPLGEVERDASRRGYWRLIGGVSGRGAPGAPAPLAKTGFSFKAGDSKKVKTAKATLPEKELDLDLRHNLLQEALYQRLEAKYGKDYVRTEQPSGVGTLIDIVVKLKDEYWFYEIKTALTPRACLREAIGQLLEYAFWPGAREPTRFIVVGESPIDKDGQEYLRRLRKRFSLAIEYEAIAI